MRLEIKVAVKRSDMLRCQYFVAENYNKHYDIFFSRDIVNLNARIEPYPDRYVMGMVDGEIVATAGLYLHHTYVERFGQVADEEIDRALSDAGVFGRYRASRKREYTKLVIGDEWVNRGLGRKFFAATHSRDFLQIGADEPHLIMCCAKLSIFHSLYEASNIRTRVLKPFPMYEVHSRYRTENDPMESRMIIPELDIPASLYERSLPIELEIESKEKSS